MGMGTDGDGDCVTGDRMGVGMFLGGDGFKRCGEWGYDGVKSHPRAARRQRFTDVHDEMTPNSRLDFVAVAHVSMSDPRHNRLSRFFLL